MPRDTTPMLGAWRRHPGALLPGVSVPCPAERAPALAGSFFNAWCDTLLGVPRLPDTRTPTAVPLHITRAAVLLAEKDGQGFVKVAQGAGCGRAA
jgi:hypothetical protein